MERKDRILLKLNKSLINTLIINCKKNTIDRDFNPNVKI